MDFLNAASEFHRIIHWQEVNSCSWHFDDYEKTLWIPFLQSLSMDICYKSDHRIVKLNMQHTCIFMAWEFCPQVLPFSHFQLKHSEVIGSTNYQKTSESTVLINNKCYGAESSLCRVVWIPSVWQGKPPKWQQPHLWENLKARLLDCS